MSWDVGSSRGSGGASGTCRAGGAEARGEALRVAERGRQTEVWGRTDSPFLSELLVCFLHIF